MQNINCENRQKVFVFQNDTFPQQCKEDYLLIRMFFAKGQGSSILI